MAFTGRLGTDDSQFGNLELGSEGHDSTPERTATDAAALSESLTRSGAFSRVTTDDPTVSDSAVAEVTAAGIVNRTATELATASASVARTIAGVRSATDAPTASVSAARSQTLSRAATESVSVSAAPSRTYFRTLTDDVAIDQTITDDFTRTEAVGWGTGPLGTWTTDSGTTVSVDGDEAVSVGSVFMYQTVPMPAESVSALIRTISTRFLLPSSGNTFTGIELNSDDFGFLVGAYFTENASSPDTLEIGTLDNVDDVVNVTFTRGQFGILKVEFDSSTGGVRAKVWESAGGEPGWQISVVDPSLIGIDVNTLAISRDSTTSTTAKWDWVTVETPSQDSVDRFRGFNATATDAVSLSESMSTGPTGDATDTATASDVATRQVVLGRSVSQTVTASATAIRSASLHKSATDSVTTADAGAEVTYRTSTAAATITDSATAEKSYVRTVKDSTTGALSVWPMDDAGSSLRDNLDSNPLTLNGTVPSYQVSSPTGGGVGFNNSAYFQNTSPSGLPTGAAARSIQFWFKGTSTSKQTIFSYGTNTTRRSYSVAINEGGSNRIGVWTFSDDGSVSAPGINNGAWHQITVTFDGTTTSFYMDGSLLGTDTYGAALNTLVSAAGLVVGRDHHTGANFARSGSVVSGLHFWDRALSAAEVAGDTIARAVVLSRDRADSPTVTDAATRQIAHFRAISDTTTTTESTAELQGVSYSRTASESVTLSEAATQTTGDKYRTVTDGSEEYCLDFGSGFPAGWTNDGFAVSGGEIVTGPGEFDSFEYDGDTPTGATTVTFDFLTPDPIDDDYWFIEIDTYGMYVFIDNWFDTLGDTFGLYVLGNSIEIPGGLTADTRYSVKLYADHSTGFSLAKIWLFGDPEPDWMIEYTFDSVVPSWPWAGYYEIDGAGSGAVDNICWAYELVTSDSVDRQLNAYRTATDTVETDDWIVNGGTVDEDVYGQVPNGYQPELAAPINDTQTTITVTQPLPPGTQLPILVYINGEWVLVTAVSPDGLTWTVVRGQNGSTATSHGTGSILPANTTISVGGVQVGAPVQYNKTRLSTYANGNVGTGEIWIRDVDRELSFATGAEVVVRHRNVRVWGGYVANVKRSYAFPGGTGDTATEPRFLVLEVVDYNILLRKRVYYDKDTPTHMKVRTWPNGTHDDVVIGWLVSRNLDLRADGLSYDIHHVGTPGLPVDSCNPDAPDRFQIGWAGYTWQDTMRAIADQTGAIFYIDPDKVFRYVDDSTKQSAFGYTGLSDDPGGTVIGYRDFELSNDGTKLVNDQFTWGAGQGNTEMVLGHEWDLDSIDEHGLWQQAEVRYDMYCQGTVDLRAETWLDGSPQNHRGYKSDHIAARATVFTPYFRVADVVTLESTSFDFSSVIPIRGAEITFPTPWDIQCMLTVSHEKDSPWEAYEFAFPDFDFDFRFNVDPIDPIIPWGPYDPCAGDDTPEVTSGGQAVDDDVWPPSQIVSHHLTNWTPSEDGPPSGDPYWGFTDTRPTQTWQRVFTNPLVSTSWDFGFADTVYHTGIFRTPTGAIDEGPPINGRTSSYRSFRAPENEVIPNAPVYAHITGTITFAGVMKNRPGYHDLSGFQTGIYRVPLPAHNVVLSLLLEDSVSPIPILFNDNPLLPGLGFALNEIGSPIVEGSMSPGEEIEVDTYVSVPSGKHFALSLQVAGETTEEGFVTSWPDGVMDFVWGGPQSLQASLFFATDLITFSHNPDVLDDPGTGSSCEDTFTRTEGSGWGLSEIELIPWEQAGGSVNGSAGVISPGSTVGWVNSWHALHAPVPTLPFEALVDFSVDSVDPTGLTYCQGYLDFFLSTGSGIGQNAYARVNVDRLSGDLSLSCGGPSGNSAGTTVFTDHGDWNDNVPLRLRLYVDSSNVKARVWKASETEPGLWHTYSEAIPSWTYFSIGGSNFPGTFYGGPANAMTWQIDNLRITGACGDECDDVDPGDLADPSDQTLYGVPPIGGVLLENGNYLYTFDVQFLPGSTEVWADGLRLRIDEDYDEHPENAAIEIHSDAQSGFTVFDPGMVVVANLTPFITHDPPPEYVEP